jgi:hypothetical protein
MVSDRNSLGFLRQFPAAFESATIFPTSTLAGASHKVTPLYFSSVPPVIAMSQSFPSSLQSRLSAVIIGCASQLIESVN